MLYWFDWNSTIRRQNLKRENGNNTTLSPNFLFCLHWWPEKGDDGQALLVPTTRSIHFLAFVCPSVIENHRDWTILSMPRYGTSYRLLLHDEMPISIEYIYYTDQGLDILFTLLYLLFVVVFFLRIRLLVVLAVRWSSSCSSFCSSSSNTSSSSAAE